MLERKKFRLRGKHILFITLGILVLIVTNFLVAFRVPETSRSDILTVISGWISGISTTILGLIAIKQTTNYDDLSNDFLEKQAEVLKNIELFTNKQNEEMWRARYSDLFMSYYNSLLTYESKFDKFSADKINLMLGQRLLHKTSADDLVRHAAINNEFDSLVLGFRTFCITNLFYFEGKDDLLHACEKYHEKATAFCWSVIGKTAVRSNETDSSSNINDTFNSQNEENQKLWNELEAKFISHKVDVEVFCLRLIDDGVSQETLKSEVVNMYERQKEFVESLLSGKKEVDNGSHEI